MRAHYLLILILIMQSACGAAHVASAADGALIAHLRTLGNPRNFAGRFELACSSDKKRTKMLKNIGSWALVKHKNQLMQLALNAGLNPHGFERKTHEPFACFAARKGFNTILKSLIQASGDKLFPMGETNPLCAALQHEQWSTAAHVLESANSPFFSYDDVERLEKPLSGFLSYLTNRAQNSTAPDRWLHVINALFNQIDQLPYVRSDLRMKICKDPTVFSFLCVQGFLTPHSTLNFYSALNAQNCTAITYMDAHNLVPSGFQLALDSPFIQRRYDSFACLLELGYKPITKDINQILLFACELMAFEQFHVLKKFLERRFFAVNQAGAHGDTVAHYVARTNQIDLLKELQAQGANFNIADDNKRTPLFYACGNHEVATADFLLDAGVEALAKDYQGNTVVNYYCLSSFRPSWIDLALLERLLQLGCSANQPNVEGYSPMHYVASSPYSSAIARLQLLYRYGADVHACGPYGDTAYHNVARCGNKEALEFLLAAQM